MDPIQIDYDHIDVAGIMDQIKAQIAQRPKPTPQDHQQQFREEWSVQSPPQLQPEPEGPASPRSRAKRIMLKVMKPFAPVIKFLVLPVHEELRQTILSLDRTNRRLDSLCATMEEELRKLDISISKGLGETNKRIDEAFLDLHRSRDYTKLLHNLSQNIVVELTKLKIEEEGLKSKARIMEKDFEFLQKREKSLEKLALK
jgi:hypothetical protein